MSNNEIREKRKKVICDLVKDDFYVPMKEKELAMFLQVAKEDREEFREILRELLAEGKLTLTVKGKYMKSDGNFYQQCQRLWICGSGRKGRGSVHSGGQARWSIP